MLLRTSVAAVVVIALFSAFVVVEDPVDVSGKWILSSESPRGTRTSEMTIAQDGEQITVTMESRRGDPMESKGTIKGNKISWSSKRETPRGTFEISYSGTVENGKMSGTVSFGSRGSSNWTAVRPEKPEQANANQAG